MFCVFTGWQHSSACFDAKVMVLVGFAVLTHRGRRFPQKAAPAVGYTVGPAAADGVAKRLALGWVGSATRVVTARFRARFPATAFAVRNCIFGAAAAPIVRLFFPCARD